MVRLASMLTRRPILPAESLDLGHCIEFAKRRGSNELAVWGEGVPWKLE